QAGGVIFLQLWALGRTANPQVKEKEGTGDVVSASDIPENSEKVAPRPLTEEEIWEYVSEYATAAKNAVEGAGFDGVGQCLPQSRLHRTETNLSAEIHGANGSV